MNKEILNKIINNDFEWIDKNINKISSKQKNHYLIYTYKNEHVICFEAFLDGINNINDKVIKEIFIIYKENVHNDVVLFEKLKEKKYSQKSIEKIIHYYHDFFKQEYLKEKPELINYIHFLYGLIIKNNKETSKNRIQKI